MGDEILLEDLFSVETGGWDRFALVGQAAADHTVAIEGFMRFLLPVRRASFPGPPHCPKRATRRPGPVR